MPTEMEIMGVAHRIQSINDPELREKTDKVFKIINSIHVCDYCRKLIMIFSALLLIIYATSLPVILYTNIIKGGAIMLILFGTVGVLVLFNNFVNQKIKDKHESIRGLIKQDIRYLQALRELDSFHCTARQYIRRHIAG